MPRPARGRYARNAMLVAVATATLACGGTTVPGAKDAGTDSSTGDGSVNDASTDTGLVGFDATPFDDVFIPDDSGGVPLYGGTPSP